MQKCSICGHWFKNYAEMSKHFDKCIDDYVKAVDECDGNCLDCSESEWCLTGWERIHGQ